MSKQQSWKYSACCMGFLILILDSRNAVSAAGAAVNTCLEVIIPSLFPLLVLVHYGVPMFFHVSFPILRKIMSLSKGCESIFCLSLIGGYPAGAQALNAAKISAPEAERMLGFCSNCGPAFLFGAVAPCFSSVRFAGALWLIQGLSAVSVAAFWPPVRNASNAPARISGSPDLSDSIYAGLRATASVCAWVILAQITLSFLNRLLYPFFSNGFLSVCSGFLEVTVGCLNLTSVIREEMRFLAAAAVTSFGGICVMLQIRSIVQPLHLSIKEYWLQKILQTVWALLYAGFFLLFSWWGLCLSFAAVVLFKKAVEKRLDLLYNRFHKGVISYAVSETD